jgi:hypothetical protein
MKKTISLKRLLSVAAATAVVAVSTMLPASATDLSCGVVRFNDRTFSIAPGGIILGDTKNAKNTGWDAVNIPGFTDETNLDNSIASNPELWSKVKTITAKFYIEKADPTAEYVASDITSIAPYMYFGVGKDAGLVLDDKGNLVSQLPDGLKFGEKSELTVTWNVEDGFAKKGSSAANGGLTKLGLKLNNTSTDTMKLKIIWKSAEIKGDDAVIKKFSDIAANKYGVAASTQATEKTSPPETSAKAVSSVPETSAKPAATTTPATIATTAPTTSGSAKVSSAAVTSAPATVATSAATSQIVSQFAPSTTPTTPVVTSKVESGNEKKPAQGAANESIDTTKASPDTGVGDMAVIISLAALAVGSLIVFKK